MQESKPTPRNPRRSAEQWRILLQSFEQSGLSAEDFCCKEHLSTTSLHRWRRRLLAEASAQDFIELRPTDPTDTPVSPTTGTLELDLPGGIRLRIRY